MVIKRGIEGEKNKPMSMFAKIAAKAHTPRVLTVQASLTLTLLRDCKYLTLKVTDYVLDKANASF